jgi:hypothetical protein
MALCIMLRPWHAIHLASLMALVPWCTACPAMPPAALLSFQGRVPERAPPSPPAALRGPLAVPLLAGGPRRRPGPLAARPAKGPPRPPAAAPASILPPAAAPALCYIQLSCRALRHSCRQVTSGPLVRKSCCLAGQGWWGGQQGILLPSGIASCRAPVSLGSLEAHQTHPCALQSYRHW